MSEKNVDFGFKRVKKSEKPGLVNRVFSGVAGKYDVMNDVMSVGIHRVWKDFMLDWIAPRSGQTLLDVAGGTGDIAMRFIDRCEGYANAIVADFTEEMIFFGKSKSQDYEYCSQLDWLCADAMNLPVSDEICDVYTISFGLRNVADLEVSLREAYRVLKQGGRIMILEFSTPKDKNIQWLYDKYSFDIIPFMGKLVAKDSESYRYLVESIRKFPKQNELANKMKTAGFRNVKYRNLSLGIVALHSGWKI